MRARVILSLVLLTGLCLADVSAQARPVYLFSALDDAMLYEGLDARDSQNRSLSDAKSVLMLRETFAVSLYQILMVRGMPLAALVRGLVEKNFPTSSSLGIPVRKFITRANSLYAILARQLDKILLQTVAVFLSIAMLGGVFTIATRRPPVFGRTLEVLRC